MVKIIIQKPDKTVVRNPEEIEIRRNVKSEAIYEMLEKNEFLSEKKEQEQIFTNTMIVQKATWSSENMEKSKLEN